MPLIRFAELKSLGIPWSQTHIDHLEREGRFPKRKRFTARTVGWDRAELDAWIQASLATESRTAA